MANDTNHEVSRIDRSTREYFARDPDRPRIRRRAREAQPPDVKRAKTRRRVAAWRVDNDRKGRPETTELGLAALDALLRSLSTVDDVSLQQHAVVSRLLVDLQAGGYSIPEALKLMKKRRKSLLAEDAQRSPPMA